MDIYFRFSMSDGRQTPDNGGPDQGPPGSAMPSTDADTSKKSAIPRTAFDDGALKVMEDEFQVSISVPMNYYYSFPF